MHEVPRMMVILCSTIRISFLIVASITEYTFINIYSERRVKKNMVLVQKIVAVLWILSTGKCM